MDNVGDGKPRRLVFSDVIREDYTLMEVDEEMLQEISTHGWEPPVGAAGERCLWPM